MQNSQPYGANLLIDCLFGQYGHVIPYNEPKDGAQFAELIRSFYDCEGSVRNNLMATFASKMEGKVVRHPSGCFKHIKA